MIRKNKRLVSAMLFVSLAGCGTAEPEGQILAVVNGEEITMSEINAEIGDTSIPEGVDKAEVRKIALQRVIERRLLAQAARDEGLDRDPAYIVEQRRLEESLLVRQLRDRALAAMGEVSAEQVDKFIAENPNAFSDRRVFRFSGVRFVNPNDRELFNALAEDKSFDEAVGTLQQNDVVFARVNGDLDSAGLGPTAFRQFRSLGKNEFFIFPEGQVVTIGLVQSVREAPLTGAQARSQAVATLRANVSAKTLKERLAKMQTEAEVSYQDGYAPAVAADTVVPK